MELTSLPHQASAPEERSRPRLHRLHAGTQRRTFICCSLGGKQLSTSDR